MKVDDPFFWPDGDIYEGNFKDNVFDGEGSYYS